MAAHQGVLGLKHRKKKHKTNKKSIFFYQIHRTIIKNLFLQKHLAQILELWYVTLPSGHLSSLFKWRSQGSKWPRPRGPCVWSMETEPLSSDAWNSVYSIALLSFIKFDQIKGPIGHGKWCPSFCWLMPMQTQTEFLQHIQFEQWHT